MHGTDAVAAEIQEKQRAQRFRSAIPAATVVTTGGLPEIFLSWVFLRGMRRHFTPTDWSCYLNGVDEVKIR